MAKRTWTLLDTNCGTHVESISIGADDVEGSASGYSVTKRTLQGGLSQGVELIEVDNGSLRFAILPTRGMGIWKAWHGDLELGWQSPVRGPVHPGFVPVRDPGGLGWLDGFDEMIVRCGLQSNGAPEFDDAGRLSLPLHGRIANLPAHRVELTIDGDTGEIEIVGTVDEARFHFQKLRLTTKISTRPGETGFRIRDEVENFSGNPDTMQMLYHCNFGTPLLNPGSQVFLPVDEMTPREAGAAAAVANWDTYAPPKPGTPEHVYFFRLLGDEDGATQALLASAEGDRGVSMHYNTQQLPCFSLWKNTAPTADGYVTGLEPATNFPNPKSHETEHGRVVELEAGGKVAFDLGFEFHSDAASVASARESIAKLQSTAEPTIHQEPQSGWTA